jgi:glutathione synthase/RimK-type ligase-like ATP-grasp enzyme
MRSRTVPDHGQVVRVKDVINCNRAEENENPKSRIAEPLIALGRKISGIIGTRLVGIDIITNNLEIDLHEAGGAVIDVNTTPGFYYHHLKKDHRSLVSVQVLQRALEDRVEGARSG